MQNKMLEFLCISGVPGGSNVVSPATGRILSLPIEDSYGFPWWITTFASSLPQGKKSLHQDFGKAQLTAQVLSVLGYFTTGKQGSSC